MPAERFYIDQDLEKSLFLEGPEFHHLAHVMRIKPGEEIELINGKGALAQAKVKEITKHAATLDVISVEKLPLQEAKLILAVPLMRPSKLELVLEKCTELGADGFWLYAAHHSEKEELSPNQTERLKCIAISAMKQCGRLDLPPIRIIARFSELFGDPYTYLFGDPRSSNKKIPLGEKIVFITGPEKGFSEKELSELEKRATGICLHQNILRAETAPILATCLCTV